MSMAVPGNLGDIWKFPAGWKNPTSAVGVGCTESSMGAAGGAQRSLCTVSAPRQTAEQWRRRHVPHSTHGLLDVAGRWQWSQID
mmetsp:Transcript_58979/g.138850  ORF Transcript_58979/g.138850 Transcript_58979/m.138850 type:complete len:84 (+) Transcript_58979:347-598(+)